MRYLYVCIIMITTTLAFAQPIDCGDKMIVVADEGAIWHWFIFPDDTLERKLRTIEQRWRDLKLTIKAEDAVGGSTINGEVQHGYGAGSFAEEIMADEYITNASISSMSDRIAFSLTLADDVPSTLTELISIKPEPIIDLNILDNDPLNSYYRELHRDGVEELPFQWNALSVINQDNQPVDYDARISNVLPWVDVVMSQRVMTSGFSAEVEYVGIHQLNRRHSVYYQFVPSNNISMYYLPLDQIEDNLFFRYLYTTDFSNERPITFEVRLANGECHFITTDEVAAVITLTPATTVQKWNLH